MLHKEEIIGNDHQARKINLIFMHVQSSIRQSSSHLVILLHSHPHFSNDCSCKPPISRRFRSVVRLPLRNHGVTGSLKVLSQMKSNLVLNIDLYTLPHFTNPASSFPPPFSPRYLSFRERREHLWVQLDNCQTHSIQPKDPQNI